MESKIIKFICRDKKHLLDFGILRRELHRFYMRHYDTPISKSIVLKNLGISPKNSDKLKVLWCDSRIHTDKDTIDDEYYFITRFSENVEALELKHILKYIYSTKFSNFLGRTEFLQYITVEPLKED